MAKGSPPVDARTREDLEQCVRALLADGLPGWAADAPRDGAAAALLRVFAHYGELILDRINRVPDRHRLAFLRHLGAAPRPAQPARVPVTFVLSAGARGDVVVPGGTQVSTAGAAPIVFETDRQLGVTATRLAHVFVKDPLQDRVTDAGALLTDASAAIAPFTGAQPIEHVGWLGHPDFFGARPLDELILKFHIDEAAGPDAGPLAWSLWNGVSAVPLDISEDTTASLTRSGEVRFVRVPTVPESQMHGRAARWVRVDARGRVASPTAVRSVTMERAVARADLRPDAAVANDAPVDLSKDFQPWEEQPRVGDVLYLAQREAFSLPLATVTLSFTASTDAAAPVSAASPGRQTLVSWEVWTGERWAPLGTGRSTEDVLNQANGFSDTTRALGRSGRVTFRVPATVRERAVAGVSSHWVRARLIAGGYVDTGGFSAPPIAGPAGVAAAAASPATAPSIQSLAIAYSLAGPITSTRPEVVLGENDFQVADLTRELRELGHSVELLRPTAGRRAALYLGFEPVAGGRVPAAPISVFVGVDEGGHQVSTGRPEPKEPLLVWEYRRREAGPDAGPAPVSWQRLGTRDRTRGLTRSGIVEILLPHDIAETREFGRPAIWVRLVRRAPTDDRVLALRLVRPNTVEATQAVTFRDEILGSSIGAPRQEFRVSRGGLLADPQLEVQESTAAGEDGWIAWREVADFHESTPTDHHYLLDHDEGLVTFGDGAHGRVPPRGLGNVRLRRYRTGGGSRGNVPAGAIVQLKTTIPYVERVFNAEPSSGGSDAESTDEFGDRVAAVLRHQDRAVAAEDFEDLARLASTEVARARCFPLSDLSEGVPSGRPGTVSLVIVPRSTDRRPLPSTALLDRVHDYLSERQAPSAKLVVCGPEYVAIDVEADVVVAALDRVTDVDAAIGRAIAAFLDPLRGGPSATGWEFGRRPHRSDVFSLIAAIDGVDHVKSVRISAREDRPGLLETTRFLVCAGTARMWFYAE